MRLLWVFQYTHSFEYLMTMHDGHSESWAYLSRYYDVHVMAPANFTGCFTRDHYTAHGRPTFEELLPLIEEMGPWDAILCYGPFGQVEWPTVKMRSGNAVFCLDYAGGPLCDLDGNAHPAGKLFDHVFTAHETQATFLRERGVAATKARGVPTNVYRPIPGVPKLWHVICPNTMVPGKRNPLVAQYCEQYAPQKPSLFMGGFENPAIVDMIKCGGIPLNKPEVEHRNNIQLGGRAPYAAMPLIYNAADVLVTGSQEEAGPWVALEAMACGTPVVVMADCSWLVAEAFAELEHDYGGVRVVPPNPTAIHEAVEDLLSYGPQIAYLARDAIVKRYDWWGQYEAVDSTIKRLVGLRAAGQVAA